MVSSTALTNPLEELGVWEHAYLRGADRYGLLISAAGTEFGPARLEELLDPQSGDVILFWTNVSLFVVLAQVLTLQTFDIRVEPSQTSVSQGVILIWMGASWIAIIVCGRNWYRLALRTYLKKRRPDILARYQYWDMEKEVLGEPNPFSSIIATLWASFTIGFIIWFIAPATTPIEVEPKSTLASLASFLLPVSWGMSDYRHGETKREKLDALGPAFHTRLPISEILSMYECLRFVPPVFWKEYTELPEVQINSATNQEFRNRTSPYQVLESQIAQRVALTIAVVALAVAALSVASLFLEGTPMQWFNDLFTAPTSP